MNILGLIGPAGCGKDTIANLLKNYGYERVASADAMKEDAMRYFDIELSDLEYYKNAQLGITAMTKMDESITVGKLSIRHFLQTYGMDMRYRFGDDYWIDRSVSSKIEERGEDARIILTDVRFQNEIDYIKSRNGLVAYVKGRSKLKGEQKNHISESLANSSDIEDKVDFTIDNSGSLDDLEKQIKVFTDMRIIK